MHASDSHTLDRPSDCSDSNAAARQAREGLSLCAAEQSALKPSKPKEGEARLPEQVKQKEQELELKYPGIKFVAPGVKLGDQEREGSEGTPVKRGVAIISRAPTMKELAALDSALQHSEPSYRMPDGRPLQIAFANQSPEPGPNGPGAAFSPADAQHPNGPELDVYPDAGRLPPLQKDARDRQDITQAQSLEGVLDHELGHAAQYRTGGLSPESDAQYKYDAGWVPLKQPPGKDSDGWALRGKDGYLYQPAGESAGGQETWLRLQGGKAVDSQGRPVGAGYDADGNYKGRYLDGHGRPLQTLAQLESGHKPPGNIASIGTLDMANRAAVKPISPYFPNPEEELAEGIRAYRTDSDSRRQFLQRSPELYRATQRLDQLDLDKTFGAGQKIRLPDGTIADTTPANELIVRHFEERQR